MAGQHQRQRGQEQLAMLAGAWSRAGKQLYTLSFALFVARYFQSPSKYQNILFLKKYFTKQTNISLQSKKKYILILKEYLSISYHRR